MKTDTSIDKHRLRQEYLLRRNTLDERAARSVSICNHIINLAAYQAARTIHCYIPIRSEVDTYPLIHHALAHKKRVVVPVVQHDSLDLAHSWLLSAAEEDLIPGVFRTLQPRVLRPASVQECDVIIVPLVAFHRRGYRLGYGKGYYDRLLTAAGAIHSIGAAFAVQEADIIPYEEHDIPLHCIVTEQEVMIIQDDA